jgi:two-component system chemotaxis response regulator CheB
MDAFPTDIGPEDGERHTGMVCPDCNGALGVQAEDPTGRLLFRCRVGHAYSAEEVLIGKEERLEAVLWSAVHAAEELAAFLDGADDRVASLEAEERRSRIASLRANARIIRDVIANDRPVILGPPAE